MLAMAGCVPAQKIGRRKYAPLARQRGATSTKKNRQARWYALAPHAGGICDGRLSRQSSRKIRDVTKLRPLKIFNATKCHETFAIHNAANSCNINKFRSRGLLRATNMSRNLRRAGFVHIWRVLLIWGTCRLRFRVSEFVIFAWLKISENLRKTLRVVPSL